MKKILFLLAAVSLTLTSCMKEDGSYKRLEPVIPGLNIYSGAMTQQRIATQPLDQVMRLAVLLSEADVQQKGIDDLPSMMVTYGDGKKVNAYKQLFRDETIVSKTADGDYTMEFAPETTGYYTCVGIMTIDTNGVPLLQDTDNNKPWIINLPEDFKIRMASNNSSTGYSEVLLEGSLLVYKNGTYYSLQVSNMKAYMKESSAIYSNWNGSFELTPPAGGESLAFSTLIDKKFQFDGQASGPTCVTYDGRTGAQMSYSVTDGVYKNNMQCLNGTETAKLTGYGDYDTSMYPAPNVQIDWVLSADEKSLSQTVIYNGYTVTM